MWVLLRDWLLFRKQLSHRRPTGRRMVGVALDTMRQLQTLVMRQYRGFIR